MGEDQYAKRKQGWAMFSSELWYAVAPLSDRAPNGITSGRRVALEPTPWVSQIFARIEESSIGLGRLRIYFLAGAPWLSQR